jgi:hypothetical protein
METTTVSEFGRMVKVHHFEVTELGKAPQTRDDLAWEAEDVVQGVLVFRHVSIANLGLVRKFVPVGALVVCNDVVDVFQHVTTSIARVQRSPVAKISTNVVFQRIGYRAAVGLELRGADSE